MQAPGVWALLDEAIRGVAADPPDEDGVQGSVLRDRCHAREGRSGSPRQDRSAGASRTAYGGAAAHLAVGLLDKTGVQVEAAGAGVADQRPPAGVVGFGQTWRDLPLEVPMVGMECRLWRIARTPSSGPAR